MEIPSGHQGVIPYLAMDEAGDFLEFVEKVFDAKLTYPDERPTEFKGHFEVSISGCTVMFSSTSEKCKPAPANLFVYVEDADQDLQPRSGKRGVEPDAARRHALRPERRCERRIRQRMVDDDDKLIKKELIEKMEKT